MWELTPSKHIRGWNCLVCWRMFLKYSLHADRTSLWAGICLKSSLTNVTSWRYDSFLNKPKDLETLVWKSFHLRLNFSDIFVQSIYCSDRVISGNYCKISEFFAMNCTKNKINHQTIHKHMGSTRLFVAINIQWKDVDDRDWSPTCGQQQKVAPGISASVSVHPLQPQSLTRGWRCLIKTVGVAEMRGTEETDWSVLDEHPHHTFILTVLGRPGHVAERHVAATCQVVLGTEGWVDGAKTENKESKEF